MSVWPKEATSKCYKCSDGEVFLDEKEAVEHERKLGLAALCEDVFGGGECFTASEICELLEKSRDLFLTWMNHDYR